MRITTVVALVASLVIPCIGNANGLADDNAWIANLRCKDLIGSEADQINNKNFPLFSMWLRGYIAGLSSLSKVSMTQHLKMSDYSAAVLTLCSQKPNDSAVEAAIDGASFFYDVLEKKNSDLKNPGNPAAEN